MSNIFLLISRYSSKPQYLEIRANVYGYHKILTIILLNIVKSSYIHTYDVIQEPYVDTLMHVRGGWSGLSVDLIHHFPRPTCISGILKWYASAEAHCPQKISECALKFL